MKHEEVPGNRIDEVRNRLSQAALAASTAEQREQLNQPAPLAKPKGDAPRTNATSILIVVALAAVILGLTYFISVRIMFPKFEAAPGISQEAARNMRAKQRKELERLLNESNAQDPLPPSAAHPVDATATPARP